MSKVWTVYPVLRRQFQIERNEIAAETTTSELALVCRQSKEGPDFFVNRRGLELAAEFDMPVVLVDCEGNSFIASTDDAAGILQAVDEWWRGDGEYCILDSSFNVIPVRKSRRIVAQ